LSEKTKRQNVNDKDKMVKRREDEKIDGEEKIQDTRHDA
jgi:hypothetical protein